MAAVDAWIDQYEILKPFLPVEDVFTMVVELLLQVVSKQVLLIQEMQLKSLVWS
jgi:hypothetical protein